MKKVFCTFLAVLMVIALSVTAMAAAICEPEEAYAGTRVVIDGFYNDTYGECDDIGTKYLTYDNYTLSKSWTNGSGDYVQELRIDEDKHEVYLIIVSPLPSTKEKDITGTITLRERESGVKYQVKLEKGDLVVNADYNDDNLSAMLYLGNKEFGLPYDYQTYAIKFETDSGDTYGKFYADFEDDAYLKITVVDQKPLFLGYNTNRNATVSSKYPNAALRFVTWNARPTFDVSGTLGIYMDPEEWIYGVNTDGSLYRLGGTYNTQTGAYEVQTATLGSYVISDTRLLPAAGTSSSSSTPASSSAASVPASSSSAVSTPASASSAAPSDLPESSSFSETSSESLSESSASLPESSASSGSSQPVDAPVEKEKGEFPLVPILVVALVVFLLVLIFVLYGKRRSRKPRFDDWDDDQ